MVLCHAVKLGFMSLATNEGKITVYNVLYFPTCAFRSVDVGSGVFLVFPYTKFHKMGSLFPPPSSVCPSLSSLSCRLSHSPALPTYWEVEMRHLVKGQLWRAHTRGVFVWDLPVCSYNTNLLFAFLPVHYETVQGQMFPHPPVCFPILFSPCLEFLSSYTLWKLVPASHA